MARIFAALVLGAALSLPALPGAAQDPAMTVTGATQVLEVQVSSAVTVTAARSFDEPSIADVGIASLSDRMIYLVGKGVGTTTLTLIAGMTPEEVWSITVVSYRDVAPLQAFLSGAAEGVALTHSGTVVTATGCVASAQARAAVDSVTAQLTDWGYVTLADVGDC